MAAVKRFFAVSFPGEIYRAGRWCLATGLTTLALTGTFIAMVVNNPSIALSFLDEDQIRSLVDHDFEAYYSQAPPQDFAVGVWTNNAFVSAICLAGGVLIFPTLLLLWSTALNAGVTGGVMTDNGRADVFLG
jgi:uncharacterized membrane protein SpoIIM required for sporulation